MTKCANNLCNRIYCDICLNDFFAETENEENFVCACKSKDSNSSILRLRENNKFHVIITNNFINSIQIIFFA